MRMKAGLGVVTGLVCVGGAANAGTAISNFQVQLQIVAQCVINSTATLNFGSPGVLGGSGGTTNTDQTTTLAVQCTNTTPYNVGLSAGLATGATVTTRQMTGPASALLGYALFSDVAHAVNWGQTIGTDTVTGTGNGSAQALTVYGQATAGQFVAPGARIDNMGKHAGAGGLANLSDHEYLIVSSG